MSSTFLLDYLIPQNNAKHTYARTSSSLVISLQALQSGVNAFNKTKLVHFDYTLNYRNLFFMRI